MRKFLLYLLFFNLGFASAVFLARNKPHYVVPDVMVAFEQALEEVEKGCPRLLEYGTMLEKENARLRRVMKTMVLPKKVEEKDSSP